MPTCEDCRNRPATMRMNFADHGNTPGGERDVCFTCATGLPGSVLKLYAEGRAVAQQTQGGA